MVNFKKLTDKAKDAVEKRGGTDALKSDAKEVAGIMKGKGSLKDKAAKAKEAMQDPGEKGSDRETAGPGPKARQHDGGAAGPPRAAAKPGPAVPGSEDPPTAS
jgi:hypothetical protein